MPNMMCAVQHCARKRTDEALAMPSKPNPEFVASFARGLEVIRSFGPDHRRQTLTEVADRTGLTRATARRFLLTLAELGLARSDGKYFELTPAVLDLGHAYLSSLNVWDALQPSLDAVSRDLDESCSAAVLSGTEIIYIARAASRHRILSIGLRVGTRLPAHATSMGQALIAHAEPATLAAYFRETKLQSFTSHTLAKRGDLEARLAAVRAQGYAVCDQELEEGLRSIAVPIFNRRGSTLAAINVSSQAARTSVEHMLRVFLPRLKAAAREINQAIYAL
jgi:IclR family pca regulon transcriptional regulator